MASLPLFIVPIFEIIVVVIFIKLKLSESSLSTGMVHHAEQDCGPRRKGLIRSPEIRVGISSITTVQRLITAGHFLNESTLAKGALISISMMGLTI
ncbi:hypothetical protein TorRG33x02_321350 [Trema orientale]|uniref:Uncharacterized protein n=1 Tax=Trema orientale TaxID=63057 RepID=A0A2P5BGY8_TREOI|nr:hypothetical protein TorRG33x02_321350 [Trema orientale]